MKLSSHALINISASIFSLLSSIAATAVSSAPVVDLGYALHKATISAVTLLYTSNQALLKLTGKPCLFHFPQYSIRSTSLGLAEIFQPSATPEQSLGRYPKWILR
jgi:hypothetical protein